MAGMVRGRGGRGGIAGNKIGVKSRLASKKQRSPSHHLFFSPPTFGLAQMEKRSLAF